MKATEVLRREHEELLRFLSILDKICRLILHGENVHGCHIIQVVEIIKVFVNKCHNVKEEELLFPELEKVGVKKENGPVEVMLMEHYVETKYFDQLCEAFENYNQSRSNYSVETFESAKKYIELSKRHIHKENDLFLNIANTYLSDPSNQRLVEGFEKIDLERLGAGKRELISETINELERIYLSPDSAANDVVRVR